MQKLFSRCAIIVLGCAIAMAHPVLGMEEKDDSSETGTVVIREGPEPQKKKIITHKICCPKCGAEKSEWNYTRKSNGKIQMTPCSKELAEFDKNLVGQRAIDNLNERLDKAGKDIGEHLDTIDQLKKENKVSTAEFSTLQQQHQQLRQAKNSDENTITALQACNKEILARAQSWHGTLANPKVYAAPAVLIIAWIGVHYAPRFAGSKNMKRLLGMIGVQKRRNKKRPKQLQT